MTVNYFDIEKNSNNTMLETLNAAKEQGYTHCLQVCNSDLGHFYLTVSKDEAIDKAADEYMALSNITDIEIAKEFYSEKVDIYEIDEYIESCL